MKEGWIVNTTFVLMLLTGFTAAAQRHSTSDFCNQRTARSSALTMPPRSPSPREAAASHNCPPPRTTAGKTQRGTRRALEECDVIWFHDGDGGASLTEKEQFDLRAYLDVGGVLLLSGAAGRMLNDLGIEPTPLRVLGPTEVTYVSGIRVLDKHRNHPAFAGLDTTKPVLLTTRGCNALADFHGTAGPSGELLAHGSGAEERPLVEYQVGAGPGDLRRLAARGFHHGHRCASPESRTALHESLPLSCGT